MKKRFKFVVWKSPYDKQWHFHVTASNGRIIAASEGYKSRAACVGTVASIRSHETKVEVQGV